jgi:protein TonB
MRNFLRPSFFHSTKWTIIPCTILLFFLYANHCQGQNADCDQTLTTEIDTVAQEKIIRARKNIIISEDGGKTGFAFLLLLTDSTFIATIKTVGGGACVNEGDPIHFVFADSSRLELKNMGKFNCEAKSSLYFNNHFNNLNLLETLAQKKLARLTVWTKLKFVARNVSEESASEILQLLNCFNSSLGDSTFSKLSNIKIYTVVDKQPEFNGGVEAMLTFIKNNLRYPLAARRNGAQGTVYVEFLIQKNGSITNVKTIKSVHPEVDAEAERVIRLMPPWMPALKNEKPVTVRFVLPIIFKLG